MGKTNRLAGNERKLASLLGEQRQLRERIERARKVTEEIPAMEAEIAKIDELIELGERWIRLDYPDWTGDHLRPHTPFVHSSPIRLGNGSRLALAVVREAFAPMTVREITDEACQREGIGKVEGAAFDRLANTISAALSSAKKRGLPVDHDGGYPARWFSTLEIEGPL